MKRFWKLRLWLASVYDLLWAPIDEPDASDRYLSSAMLHPEVAAHMNEPRLSTKEHLAKLSDAFDQMFDDLENIKLEQRRQVFSIEGNESRINGIKVNVTSIMKNLQHQIQSLGGEFGHHAHQQSILLRALQDDVRKLQNERDIARQDMATCMTLIRQQDHMIKSFKVTCINPSVN